MVGGTDTIHPAGVSIGSNFGARGIVETYCHHSQNANDKREDILNGFEEIRKP
jgi:hypothetical protein